MWIRCQSSMQILPFTSVGHNNTNNTRNNNKLWQCEFMFRICRWTTSAACTELTMFFFLLLVSVWPKGTCAVLFRQNRISNNQKWIREKLSNTLLGNRQCIGQSLTLNEYSACICNKLAMQVWNWQHNIQPCSQFLNEWRTDQLHKCSSNIYTPFEVRE